MTGDIEGKAEVEVEVEVEVEIEIKKPWRRRSLLSAAYWIAVFSILL
ncbi:hypothetical protein ACFLSA_05420 [Bacteroidota bacterium]